jgi:hypothetical protein
MLLHVKNCCVKKFLRRDFCLPANFDAAAPP